MHIHLHGASHDAQALPDSVRTDPGCFPLAQTPWDLAAAGYLYQEAADQLSRLQGREMACLQPGHGPHRRAGGRTAGDAELSQALASLLAVLLIWFVPEPVTWLPRQMRLLA